MTERFVKMIRFKDVQAGDVVSRKDGERLEVLDADKMFGSGVPDHLENINLLVKGEPNYLVSVPADHFVGLVHHPWSEGCVALLMQETILDAMRAFLDASESTKEEKLRAVREVMDAYELGKPEKPEPKQDLTQEGC